MGHHPAARMAGTDLALLMWDDRAAQGVVATLPAVRRHTSDAVVSGPPTRGHLAPNRQAAGRLSHPERSPRGALSF